MNFELFKETKIRYFIIKVLATLFLAVIALIFVGKGLKIKITESHVILISLAVTVVWLLLAISFIRKRQVSISSFIGRPSKKSFIFELPVSLLLTYLGSVGLILVLLFLVNCISHNIFNNLQSTLGKQTSSSTPIVVTVIGFVSAVIVTPITEELIFRGILMNRLYNKYGMVKSVIYSSLMFFVMHINPNPMLLCLGISCGILVYKYKSIIPSIILHMSNNLITSIRDLNSVGGQSASSTFNIDFGFLVMGSIMLIIYAIYVYISLRKSSLK